MGDEPFYATAIERTEVRDGNLEFAVASPRILDRMNPEIIGTTVRIGWEGNIAEYPVLAVHRRNLVAPIRVGEIIGIVVRPAKA